MTKVDQALNNFFKTGNLIALRELALREIADDVDERLESTGAKKAHFAVRGEEKKLYCVCVNSMPHAQRLIRRGFRTAYRLKAAWYVNYVHVGDPITDEIKQRLEAIERLTVSMGGKSIVHECPNPKQIAFGLIFESG